MPELVEISRTIPAPAEALWKILVDLQRLREWLPVKAFMEFPNGMIAAPGVVVRIEQESPLGFIKLEQVFERCEAPRLLSWSHRNETLGKKPVTQIKDFTSEISLESTDATHTRMTVRSRWMAVGMMGVVANSVMKPKLKREYERALENLERLAGVTGQASG